MALRPLAQTPRHPSSCCTAPSFTADTVNRALPMPEAGERFLQLMSMKGNIALTVAVQRLQSDVMSQVLHWKGIRSFLNGEHGYRQHGSLRAS